MIVTKYERGWRCTGNSGFPILHVGQWSYLEWGHGWVPAIPVYGVELGRVVELMVQLRMSFASVHHFLEGKKGRDSKRNEPNRKKAKGSRGPLWGRQGNGNELRDERLQWCQKLKEIRNGRQQIDQSLAHAHISSIFLVSKYFTTRKAAEEFLYAKIWWKWLTDRGLLAVV